jgi:hypothetical protein
MLKEYGVAIELIDEENVRLRWDGLDEVVPQSAIFTSEIRDEMIVHSLRCFCLIENKPDPTAQSVVAGIAARGGIHTPARAIYVRSITYLEARDCYQISYGYTSADASYGLEITRDDLAQRPNSALLLAYQIGAFLRFKGLTSLTPEAIDAIQSRKFRGF